LAEKSVVLKHALTLSANNLREQNGSDLLNDNLFESRFFRNAKAGLIDYSVEMLFIKKLRPNLNVQTVLDTFENFCLA